MMGRLIRTKILINNEKLKPISDLGKVHNNLKSNMKQSQIKQKQYYDRKTKLETPFHVNENVLVREGDRWIRGKIVQTTEYPRSYWVRMEDGSVVRRNTFHLKHTPIMFPDSDIPDNFDDFLEINSLKNSIRCDATLIDQNNLVPTNNSNSPVLPSTLIDQNNLVPTNNSNSPVLPSNSINPVNDQNNLVPTNNSNSPVLPSNSINPVNDQNNLVPTNNSNSPVLPSNSINPVNDQNNLVPTNNSNSPVLPSNSINPVNDQNNLVPTNNSNSPVLPSNSINPVNDQNNLVPTNNSNSPVLPSNSITPVKPSIGNDLLSMPNTSNNVINPDSPCSDDSYCSLTNETLSSPQIERFSPQHDYELGHDYLQRTKLGRVIKKPIRYRPYN
ncbi:sporozoite surface protein 2-like [Diaphorina citri]|uniref:Sporozoite surface protein 2-like n=1 Tax=Diaphorina citri TaxID=121845 RepID=A0A1S3DMC9_DIACI|nr:sporozoite surface protein 2-like [Diaphorina citri]